jgi:glycosyltransferase involved in cell wall biosynthesis
MKEKEKYIKHLFNRSGFGPTLEEWNQFRSQPPKKALKHIFENAEINQELSAGELDQYSPRQIRQMEKALSKDLSFEERVIFKGFVPFDQLHELTSQASLGLSLEENLGLNYYYASPNKVYDYIQARIPVLVSDLPEMKALVEKWQVGQVLKERKAEVLARQIRQLLSDQARMKQYREYCRVAANELIWEQEEGKLADYFQAD